MKLTSKSLFLLGCIALTSCTMGQFVDSETGQGQNDVELELHRWPPPEEPGSESSNWNWPITWAYPPDHDTTTFQGGNVHGRFAFDAYLGDCVSGVEDESIVYTDEWYRIVASKPGYNDYITYRYHDYDEMCSVQDCDTGQIVQRQCENWKEFNMEPLNTPKNVKPDLIVDSRDLSDAQFECIYSTSDPATGLAPDGFAIRVSLGTANVGTGLLYVEQLSPGGLCENNEDCPSGTDCMLTSFENEKMCLPSSCISNSDCPNELICDLSDNLCKPNTCTSSNDCDAMGSNTCLPFGTCEPVPVSGNRPCSANNPCPTQGEVCNPQGFCVGQACSDDTDCPDYNFITVPSTCYNSQCAYPVENQGWCSSNLECNGGNCNLENNQRCQPPMVQVLTGVDGASDQRILIDSEVTYHPDHQHLHTDDYAQVRLVSPLGDCDIDLDRRADYPNTHNGNTWEQDCLIEEGDKLSFCITDTNLFDSEINADYFNGFSFFDNLEQCYRHVQGMSPGYKDVYGKQLEGQMIWLGSGKNNNTVQNLINDVFGKTLHLEAVVDPEQMFTDRNYDNNWARRNITFRSLGSVGNTYDWVSFCEGEDRTRDCYTSNTGRECQEYTQYY